ncbi:hypothetical protein SRHO_G00064550 [Serrasalmus rhombeus]
MQHGVLLHCSSSSSSLLGSVARTARRPARGMDGHGRKSGDRAELRTHALRNAPACPSTLSSSYFQQRQEEEEEEEACPSSALAQPWSALFAL